MELDTLTELLNIPNYKVTRIIQLNSEAIHLLVEPTVLRIPICSGCGSPHNVPIHSIGSITVQDLNLCGRHVYLQVSKRKIRCSVDRRIRVETLNWINGRFTKRFAQEIIRLTAVTSYRGAGWFMDLDDETIHRLDRNSMPHKDPYKGENLRMRFGNRAIPECL